MFDVHRCSVARATGDDLDFIAFYKELVMLLAIFYASKDLPPPVI